MSEPVTITLLSNTRAHLQASPTVTRRVDDLLSIQRHRVLVHNPRYNNKFWAGGDKIRLLSRATSMMPAGLWRDVRVALKKDGHHVTLVDARKDASPRIRLRALPKRLGGDVVLRDYQLGAIAKAAKRERGIVQIATGGGKTETALGIWLRLREPTMLFCVHGKGLAMQTRERFAQRLDVTIDSIGLVGLGKWHEGSIGITVAMIQTMAQQGRKQATRALLQKTKMLVLDEAHHTGSKQWYNLTKLCDARYRYGLTATPTGRSDQGDLYLRAACGPVVCRIKADKLVKRGFLAAPQLHFTTLTAPYVSSMLAWSDIEKQGIIDNTVRNKLIAQYAMQLIRVGKKPLILVRMIRHGLALRELIDAEGAFLSGRDSAWYQAGKVAEFVAGELGYLIATPIFDEAKDIPAVDALLLAAGGKSSIKMLQRIGRGMRPKSDDNRVFVYDFLDRQNTTLENHSHARIGICRRENYQVHVHPQPLSNAELAHQLRRPEPQCGP